MNPPPLNKDYNRDPSIKALKRGGGVISHGSPLEGLGSSVFGQRNTKHALQVQCVCRERRGPEILTIIPAISQENHLKDQGIVEA